MKAGDGWTGVHPSSDIIERCRSFGLARTCLRAITVRHGNGLQLADAKIELARNRTNFLDRSTVAQISLLIPTGWESLLAPREEDF